MRVILDSGAYSLWRTGHDIDLDEYIKFLKTHQHQFVAYIGLDQIPGEYGRREMRPDLVEAAARQSSQNHKRMKAEGLRPVPVLHPGENLNWLKKYCDAGEPMIALSVKHNYASVPFLDSCFKVLKSYPNVRVHGLSATSTTILQRYHFDTVDSASWLKQSLNGRVPLPRYKNGQPNYAIRATSVGVTDRSVGRGNHLLDLKQHEREHLALYLSEISISLEQVRNDQCYRWRMWLHFFNGLEACVRSEIYFVCSPSHLQQRAVLAEFGIQNLLTSYFKMRNQNSNSMNLPLDKPTHTLKIQTSR
jgi:hypothetical protein